MASVLTSDQRKAFERDGYILVRGFFDGDETHLLQAAVDQDPAIRDHFYNRGDAEGLTTKMATWNHPGDSVYGYAARSNKMVDTMEDLLGGDVYHYHSKITAKEHLKAAPGNGTWTMAIGTTTVVCFRIWHQP